MKVQLRFAVLLAMSLFLFQGAHATIMPPNDLSKEDSLTRLDANMTEQEFNEIVDRGVAFFDPLAKEHKASLQVEKNWVDPTVNAYAGRLYHLWMAMFYGGLARRPEITKDAFQVVVCHEMGHLFGGYPYKRTIFGPLIWASVEGEADYFSTHVCARELWKDDADENKLHEMTVDATAKTNCDAAWAQDAERHLCYRIADAAFSIATLFAHGQSEPKFDTPDKHVVKKTDIKHPAAQCRMDTYVSGSLCDTAFNIHKIPGDKYTYFPRSLRKAEKEAAKASCHSDKGDKVGVRPRCWFHPRKGMFKKLDDNSDEQAANSVEDSAE